MAHRGDGTRGQTKRRGTGTERAAHAAVATAIAAGLLLAAPADADVLPPAAWWQFDRNAPRADEVGGPALASFPFPVVDGEFDLERVFRVAAAPGTASSCSVPESSRSDHWSATEDGVTLAALLRVVPPAGPGTEQTIAGRWPAVGEGTWRLAVVPLADGEAELVATVGTTDGDRTIVLPLPADAWRWAVLRIAPDDDVATLELIDVDGTVVDAASTALGAPMRELGTSFWIGRQPAAPTGDVEVRLEVVAGWDGPIDAATRDALVGEDGPVRYLELVAGTVIGDPGHRLERIAGILEGDRRHVVMGDSFAFAAGWNRVLPALLRVRRFEPYVGVAAGLREPHTLLRTTALLADPGSPNPRTMGAGTGYACEWVGGTDPADAYGLPTNRSLELRAHPGAVVPPDGGLLRLEVADGQMAAGATGRLADPGDRVAFRLVHRRTSAAVEPLASVRLTDPGDTASAALDLTQGPPRQAASDPAAVVVEAPADGAATAIVREASPGDFAAGPERFATLVGAVAWRVDEAGERLPGQYYTSLHDSSWAWRDFARDEEGGPDGPVKSLSRAQLAAWLAATTLDPAQPIAFWWYVDTEDRPVSILQADMRAAIELADGACADVGLPRPVHLLVVPHLHQTDGLTHDQLQATFARYRDVIDALADEPDMDHVARISIFDATDGVMFDGRPESIAWLADRGYDAFTYAGTTVDLAARFSLLDSFQSHPLDPVAAAFFATFLGAAIPGGLPAPVCPADVDGDGAIDFDDVLAVLGAFGPCPGGADPCPADVVASGVVDFDDLLAVIAAWGPCPG